MLSFYAIFLSILLTTILFFKVNSTDEITSFSIPKFRPDQPNLIFQGGGYTTKEKLTLTKANAEEAHVVINFNATTNVLSVTLLYPNSLEEENVTGYTLSEVVPLKDVVPEWVRIGFSATTGAEYATHEVLSWTFLSELRGPSNSKQAADA
ncbi:hypothetical protein RYX36_012168 [Vicia faba]